MRTLILALFALTLAAPLRAGPCEALTAAVADARRLPYDVACRTRYLYLGSDRNAVLARQVKYWANHLSREVEFGTPRSIGAGVLAVDIDDYRWDARVWEKQFQTEPFFYYVLREYHAGKWAKTPLACELTQLTHSNVPIVYADWWHFYSSRQVDLNNVETGAGYYDWLGIKDQNAFEALRFVDRKTAIKLGDELRAVLESGKSGVTNEGVDRQIEWYSSYGDGEMGLWITLDADDTRNGNTAPGKLADGEFKEKAREAFLGLPNKTWAVGAFNNKGVRQAKVPPEIAFDNGPLHRGNDRNIGPASCIHCHANGGLKPIDDWARNRGLKAPNQLDAFKFADFQRLRRQYFRDLDRQLAAGRQRYTEAIKELVGQAPATAAAEHASVYYGYVLTPRTTTDVAAYLEVTPEQLTKELRRFFDPRNPAFEDKKRLADLLPLARFPPETVSIKVVEQTIGDIHCIVKGHK